MHNQPREPQPYQDCQAKYIQEFGWTSQGMDWGWGLGIKSHQWSKVLFSDESNFCISFGKKGPRVWRNGGEAHDHGVGVLDWPANWPDLNPIEDI